MRKKTVEARKCPKCGKKMVQNVASVLMSNPPVYVGTVMWLRASRTYTTTATWNARKTPQGREQINKLCGP